MSDGSIYTYMHSLGVDGYEVGVDALTITAIGLEGKLSTSLVLHSLSEKLEVEQEKPFSFQGAKGWVRGSVRYAQKLNGQGVKLWSILMVTGKDSEDALKEALKFGDVKFTRLDLAVDVFMSESVVGLPRKLKDTYKGDHTIKLIESLTGDTIYVGARQSESMLRIYDKSAEYGECLGRVWRWEVEYKGKLAEQAARWIEREGKNCIADLVWSDVRDKNVPSPFIPNKIRLGRQQVTASSAEMKLAWLSRQVSPTVKFLRALGLQSEVVKALQLDLPVT